MRKCIATKKRSKEEWQGLMNHFIKFGTDFYDVTNVSILLIAWNMRLLTWYILYQCYTVKAHM